MENNGANHSEIHIYIYQKYGPDKSRWTNVGHIISELTYLLSWEIPCSEKKKNIAN